MIRPDLLDSAPGMAKWLPQKPAAPHRPLHCIFRSRQPAAAPQQQRHKPACPQDWRARPL